MTDRTEFEKARRIGLERRQEQRLDRATYAAAEVRVLTDAALLLGRREALAEIAAWAEDLAAGVINRDKPYNQGFIHASETMARHAREIGAKEAAPPAPATDGCASTHPMASHIPCRKAAGHPGDHESRNGRNWRPSEDGAR